MPDREAPPPLRVIKMQVFQCAERDRSEVFDKVIEAIKRRHKHVVETGNVLEVSVAGTRHRFKVEELGDFFLSTSTMEYDHNYELDEVISKDLRLFDLSDPALSSLVLNLFSTFTVFMPVAKDEYVAGALVEQYSEHLSRPKSGMGVVRGCLLSIFESGAREEELFDRYYFLSPFRAAGEAAEKLIESVLGDVKNLAVYTAELSKLYRSCKSFFSALGAGEMEISEKTESFLWKLIGPEPTGLESLESWLRYIMEREATVSTMIGTMRVNHLEAKSIVSRLEGLFKRLNESSFEDYPTSSEMEIDAYNRILKPFENYVVRTEAMKTRLETVMDEVRTYLSLQQQKISIEEQKASKEQLVRLVNLQEILHKLEILIVAFYLTEMARIVFEPLFHELANLLTAAFIPIALLASVVIGRILHKK